VPQAVALDLIAWLPSGDRSSRCPSIRSRASRRPGARTWAARRCIRCVSPSTRWESRRSSGRPV